MQNFLIIDGYTATAIDIVKIIKEKGGQVYHLASGVEKKFPNFYDREQEFNTLIESIYDGTIILSDNYHDLLDKIRSQSFVAIIPGTETAVELTNRLSHDLNLISNLPEYSILHRNKFLMQETIRKAGLRSIKSIEAKSFGDVKNFFMNNDSKKIVLKPLSAAGGENVKICYSLQEAERYWIDINSKNNYYGSDNSLILCQEFVEGKEIIINCLSYKGAHKLTEVYVYSKYPFLNNMIYAAKKIESSTSPEIKHAIDYNEKVLTALHIDNGMSHSEIMLTNDGPVLIEVGARPAGGRGVTNPLLKDVLGYVSAQWLIDLYMDPMSFQKIKKVDYAPKSSYMDMMLFSHKSGICKWENTNFLKKIKNVVDISSKIHKNCSIRAANNLVDLICNVYIKCDSEEELIQTFSAIRFLNFFRPHLIYTLEGVSYEPDVNSDNEYIQCLLAGDWSRCAKMNGFGFPLRSNNTSGLTCVQKFYDKLKQFPDKKIVTSQMDNESLTFSQFYTTANAVSNAILSTEIIKCCQKILIISARRNYLPCIIFGAWQISKSICLIDSDDTKDKIDAIVDTLKPDLIIVDDTVNNLETTSNTLTISKILSSQTNTPIHKKYFPTPDDTAVYLWTSGTTSSPKCIALNHKALFNIVQYGGDNKYSCFVEDEGICACFAPLSFTAFLLIMCLCIFRGCEFFIVNKSLLTSFNGLNQFIEDKKISTIQLPTSLIDEYLKLPPPKCLKLVLTGGDKIHVTTNNKILLNYGYGASECFGAILRRFVPIDAKDLSAYYDNYIENIVPIILNENGCLCKLNEPGILYVSGPQIMSCYLDNTQQTNITLIPNMFYSVFCNSTDDMFLLKTGDRAKYIDYKKIIILGRSDTQVKIDGNRVEIGEVEEKIRNINIFKDFTILYREFANGMGRMICFYRTHSNIEINSSEIMSKCSQNMESFKIPSYFIKVDDLPRNKNGKIDKIKLFHIFDMNNGAHDSIHTQKYSTTVSIIISILSKSIPNFPTTPDIDKKLMFYGASSSSLMKSINEINEHFRCRVSPAKLFSNPTISTIEKEVLCEQKLMNKH